MRFKVSIALLLGLGLFQAQTFAQSTTMWPGDANNNGIVNGADFIFYGLAHGSQGPERPNASSNWTPQTIVPWAQTFANGVNYAFADFDGDGEVDNSDQSKFEANWGRVHGTPQADGYGNSTSGAPLKLKLVPSATEVTPGANITIGVRLGNAQAPVNNAYGFAFKFNYTQRVVNNNGSDIAFNEVNGSWFDVGDETRHFFQKDENVGRAEAGLTRTDQMPVSGQGEVANFSIIIEDIIVGRLIDTLRITIDSIILLDGSLAPSGIEGDTVEVIVKDPNYVQTLSIFNPTLGLRCYPNPSKDGVFIVESPEPVEGWGLSDLSGRSIPFDITEIGNGLYRIRAYPASSGVYLLKAQGAGHVKRGYWFYKW